MFFTKTFMNEQTTFKNNLFEMNVINVLLSRSQKMYKILNLCKLAQVSYFVYFMRLYMYLFKLELILEDPPSALLAL